MTSTYTRLPWNDELETVLLYCVLAKGAHICSGKKISQTWDLVNDMFFDQPQLLEFKELHHKQGVLGHRKLREKFNTLIATIEKDMESGNQSGKEGELSEKYSHAKQILVEISDKLAEKEAGAELRQKLNATEKEILARSGPLKRKQLEGQLVDNTKKEKKTVPTFEQALLQLASPTSSVNSGKGTLYAEEERFEIRFKEWVVKEQRGLNDLLICAEIHDGSGDVVEDVGMKTLISIYCTRGANFSAQVFKKELRDMEIPMKVCSKLYCALQEWRREFEKEVKEEKAIDFTDEDCEDKL